jgi:hypothetical protein
MPTSVSTFAEVHEGSQYHMLGHGEVSFRGGSAPTSSREVA